MYFERYGKIFLADVGLFEDEEFFRAALAASTTTGAVQAESSGGQRRRGQGTIWPSRTDAVIQVTPAEPSAATRT